ncbi:hypothetical protein [Acinetobacter johnsonii]|uniref:hypothetical protein n=1 Tax=Acinetobacter johnsonii TaxID=40214 RepID=UPI0010398555|nr:hypothetical protein [Acinetobacter johnsonii]QBK69593.1 hypothetical protein E0Z08_08660 [Acinetobacter johnsonii]
MSKVVRARTMDRAMSFVASSTSVRFLQTSQPTGAVQYFDIDHLSRLAQEESYTMPRGLTREQRREWARKNQQK